PRAGGSCSPPGPTPTTTSPPSTSPTARAPSPPSPASTPVSPPRAPSRPPTREALVMPKTIQQRVTLPAPPATLYRMYLDPRRHAGFTGAPVKIGAKPGSAFRAFNGALSGRMLYTRPGRMIVQTWRSRGFGRKDLDSILVLTF